MHQSKPKKLIKSAKPLPLTRLTDKLVLDVAHLNTAIHISEKLSDKDWQACCRLAGIAHKGGGATVNLIFQKLGGAVAVEGEISLEAERECSRTSEHFMDRQTINVSEEMPVHQPVGENSLEIEAPAYLNVLEFIQEQILLELNPYPVKPSAMRGQEGEYDLLDGLENSVDLAEEKASQSPFAALKKLKPS